jgi:hypothetical protein
VDVASVPIQSTTVIPEMLNAWNAYAAVGDKVQECSISAALVNCLE